MGRPGRGKAHSWVWQHVRGRLLLGLALVLSACASAPVVAACRDQEMARGFMPVAYAAASDAM
ncbi:MAG TPA: hypothetical protein VI542_35605, partial [Candidatus Tectomicrobia bacterium]